MDKNILKSWRPHDTNYKKANKSKADVSVTPHFMGIPAFIIGFPQTIQKPTTTKQTKNNHQKNQPPKTGGKNSALVVSQFIKSLQFLAVKTQRKTTVPLCQAHLQKNRKVILEKGNSQAFFPSSHCYKAFQYVLYKSNKMFSL